MRSCSALYIDAGYLLASAATRVCGTSLRASVQVDHEKLIAGLIEQVERESGLPLMRANWYDSGNGSGGQPDATQAHLGMMPRVKLRLGRRSYSGEQKGVDLRLGLDLVTQARNRAIDIAYLLSGDDDLTEAVEEAQDHGVQVIVLAVPSPQGAAHAVARHLQMEADGLSLIDAATIDETVTRLPRTTEAQLAGAGAAAAAMRAMSGSGALPTDDNATDATDAAEAAEAEAAVAQENAASAVAGSAAQNEGADASAPLRPSLPTPALLGKLRAGQAAPPTDTGAPRPTGRPHPAKDAELVYSTTAVSNGVQITDHYSSRHMDAPDAAQQLQDADPASVDAVCRSVLKVWSDSASVDDVSALHHNRPSIPSDVDRALLRDLSMRINVYEIVEQDRHALRAHFWRVVDEESTAK